MRRAFDSRSGFLGAWGRTTGSSALPAWIPRAVAFLCSYDVGGQFFAAASGSEVAPFPELSQRAYRYARAIGAS